MQNKILFFFKKNNPQIVLGITRISTLLYLDLAQIFMNLKEIQKNLTPEINKELKKSKLKVLTNENDFLVKNLKKAG